MATVLQAKGGSGAAISLAITLDSPVTSGNDILIAAWTNSPVGTRGRAITYSDNQGNTGYNWTEWLGEAPGSDLIGLFTVTASASGAFTATCTATVGHNIAQMIVAELPPGYKLERGVKSYIAPAVSPPITPGYYAGNILTAPQVSDTIILTASVMFSSASLFNSQTGDTGLLTVGTPGVTGVLRLWERYENTSSGNSFTFLEAGPPFEFLQAIGAAFSKPLSRPVGMTAQYFSNSMMGDSNAPLGPTWWPSGGLWSTRAYGSFPYAPLVGDSIVLGICLANAAGAGGHVPTYTVQDNAGNTYTYRGISTTGGVNGCQIVFYTAPVTAVPATGLLRIQVDRTDSAIVQNAQALSLCGGCYSFGLDLDALTVYQLASQTGGDPSILTTDPATVTDDSLLVLVGSYNGGLSVTSIVFNEQSGFTKRAEFTGGNAAWLPSQGCLGTNAIYDKTVAAGTYTGDAGITAGQNNVLMLAIPISGMTVTCPVTNTGAVGTPFTAQILVSGGTGPYSYVVSSGALPPGLSLDVSTGEISGTPTTGGTYFYTVTVTDSLGASASTGSPCPLTIAQLAPACPLDRFELGVAYSDFLTATGGIPPYTWTVISGTLPDGITLNGATGELSGTPTTLGSGTVTFMVTDDDGNTAIVSCGVCVSLTR